MKKLPYLQVYCDRHGSERFYVRLPGEAVIPIKSAPGSHGFAEAYVVAVDSLKNRKPRQQRRAMRLFGSDEWRRVLGQAKRRQIVHVSHLSSV
jgi:hypothetical protein